MENSKRRLHNKVVPIVKVIWGVSDESNTTSGQELDVHRDYSICLRMNYVHLEAIIL